MPYLFKTSRGREIGADCESREKILRKATKRPSAFKKPTYSGKVVQDKNTKTLKKGIAFLETKPKGVIKMGLGSGAMLGGLDNEITYFPVKKDVCKKVETLRKNLDRLSYFPTEGDLLSVATPTQRRLLKKKERLEKEDEPFRKRIAPKISKDWKMSRTAISGLVKKRVSTKGLKTIKDFKTISGTIRFPRDTVKDELKNWGYTLRDIKQVHYGNFVPAIFDMKDGKQVAIAPKIDNGTLWFIEDTVKDRLKQKQETLRSRIRHLAERSSDQLRSVI
ncbi:MAG: hypothetical protein DRN81_01965 [Thermoproteota archaeon]|nr:MAG: hypothetical protein DRN81_01965 [Candidatus Korarchaeota archaeon]